MGLGVGECWRCETCLPSSPSSVETAEERVGSGDPMDVVGRKVRSWGVEGPCGHYLPFLASGSLFNLFQVFDGVLGRFCGTALDKHTAVEGMENLGLLDVCKLRC